MRRIAFIGIENADSEVLHDALRRNLGGDAEINTFAKDVAPVSVAPFLVAKNKATNQLEGKGSVAYISSAANEDLAVRIGRLSKAGVTVRTGWSDFKTEASDEEISQWLQSGEWPEPQEEEDDDADLLALLGGDDDDFFGDEEVQETQAPVAEQTSVPAPVEDENVDDDLPAWNTPAPAPSAHEAEQEVYPTRRFDSMSANDGAAETVREDQTTSLVDDEDDDLPLPAFTPPASVAPTRQQASFDAPDDEDDDELPAFTTPASVAPTRQQEFTHEDDDDDLPAFNMAPQPEPELERPESGFSFEDEDDDELPAFNVAPQPEPARAESNFSFEDDADDDLPAFDVPEQEEPPVSRSENAGRRRASEERAQFVDYGDDDDDALPQFNAQAPEPAPVTRAGRRAAEARPEIPVVDDGTDDDVELPVFNPESFVTPPQKSAPAPVEQEASDEFDDGFDALPPFSAVTEPEATPAPSRRSRKEFLEAAESIHRQSISEQASDNNDDDGDDLPDFAPQFTAPPVDADDELPVPMRRASASGNDERGDDLPEFVNRGAVETHDDEDDEEDDFTFAPKVHIPSYAAPAEKQPEWGIPVQREEVISRSPRPEPKRPESKRVAPEKVRYEKDVQSEVAAENARKRREAEGYEQPVIEEDKPNRRLRPAPDASAELRKAPQRVVNQRPAAPVEQDEPLDFMTGQDVEEDDFDPNATPPFMESLKPEERRAQSTMEQIRREYDSDSALRVRTKGSAITYYVTGSHGGAGKTTSTWMMANTMAGALKKDPSRPVFLIEGDYENSKLAQRLNLPPEKNSGKLAEFYRKLSADRSLVTKQKINMVELTERIIKESVHVNDHGVHIIAAPYDLTKRDGRFLRMAIQKSVEYAERQGGYVFIDADTLSNDDILDRTLAAKATHVIVVSFGDKDHVDDTHRAIHTLTTPNVKAVSNSASTNGMGIPKDRIKLFFNKTGSERFEDLQRVMRPYITEGHLPTVQGLNDGGWIGNLTGGDFLNAVTSYASFMNRISPMEELRPYQSRRPQKATQRSGFMKMFGSRRG